MPSSCVAWPRFMAWGWSIMAANTALMLARITSTAASPTTAWPWHGPACGPCRQYISRSTTGWLAVAWLARAWPSSHTVTSTASRCPVLAESTSDHTRCSAVSISAAFCVSLSCLHSSVHRVAQWSPSSLLVDSGPGTNRRLQPSSSSSRTARKCASSVPSVPAFHWCSQGNTWSVKSAERLKGFPVNPESAVKNISVLWALVNASRMAASRPACATDMAPAPSSACRPSSAARLDTSAIYAFRTVSCAPTAPSTSDCTSSPSCPYTLSCSSCFASRHACMLMESRPAIKVVADWLAVSMPMRVSTSMHVPSYSCLPTTGAHPGASALSDRRRVDLRASSREVHVVASDCLDARTA
eukprot:comp17948_c0_seq1/m.18260 comp17948_c0_seq1/g.18260  ORF comp17948_c0_seq1/g.18260 comp17948_c0_seq1/m.18260 type:complete len:356 (+) comp17948_c0_seq1:337-1404(+)